MSLHRLFAAIGAVIFAAFGTPAHALQHEWEKYDVASVTVSPNALAGGVTATIRCKYVPAGTVMFTIGSNQAREIGPDTAVPGQITVDGTVLKTFQVYGFGHSPLVQTVQLNLDQEYIDRNVKFDCDLDPDKIIHHSEMSITRHVAIGAYEYLFKPFDFKPTRLDMRTLPGPQRVSGQLRMPSAGGANLGHPLLNRSIFGGSGKHAIPTVQDGTVLQFNCEWQALPITTTRKSIRTRGEILIDGQPYRTFPMSVSGAYAYDGPDESMYQNRCGSMGFSKCYAKGHSGPIDWTAHGGGLHVISCRVDSDGASELVEYRSNNTIATRIKVPLTASFRRPVPLPPQMRPRLKPKPNPTRRLSTAVKPRTTILLQSPRPISRLGH